MCVDTKKKKKKGKKACAHTHTRSDNQGDGKRKDRRRWPFFFFEQGQPHTRRTLLRLFFSSCVPLFCFGCGARGGFPLRSLASFFFTRSFVVPLFSIYSLPLFWFCPSFFSSYPPVFPWTKKPAGWRLFRGLFLWACAYRILCLVALFISTNSLAPSGAPITQRTKKERKAAKKGHRQ